MDLDLDLDPTSVLVDPAPCSHLLCSWDDLFYVIKKNITKLIIK